MDDNEFGPPAALGRSTGFLLAWVAASSGAFYERALAEVDLTAQQLGVMVIVQSEGPMVQARLSERLGVFKPVMVALVNQLSAAGLVERRPHPTDRRAVEVHLLPAGAERIAAAESVSERATAEFFAPLAPDERRAFHDMLVRLAGAA